MAGDQPVDVCAVVVTFHPDTAVVANLAALREQVDRIVVVDNEATPASRALLAGWGGEGTELVFNEKNLGIAGALNLGMARAVAAGYAWVATFDQDSRVAPGHTAGLLAALGRCPQPDRVAVLAPLYRDRHLGFVFSPAGPLRAGEASDAPVSVTATSGNLVAAAAWQAVRGFREEYFIDCVDFEFCLRCRRAGWRILEVRSVVLEHAAGRWQQRRWLWKNPRFNDYPAVRRYYQARNRVFLYAAYAGFDPRWVLRDAWGYLCDGLKLLLFCTDRWTKTRALLTGIAHGFLGRSGPWPR